jgi:hypothetical protein
MVQPIFRPLLLLALLSACGGSPSDPGPGGVSNDDAKALDEAAAKLDAESVNQNDD